LARVPRDAAELFTKATRDTSKVVAVVILMVPASPASEVERTKVQYGSVEVLMQGAE
jgi:hypothetical protein